MGIVKHWNNVLRNTAESLSLEAFQNMLDRLLSEPTSVHLVPFQCRTGLNSVWFLTPFQALPLSYSQAIAFKQFRTGMPLSWSLTHKYCWLTIQYKYIDCLHSHFFFLSNNCTFLLQYSLNIYQNTRGNKEHNITASAIRNKDEADNNNHISHFKYTRVQY